MSKRIEKHNVLDIIKGENLDNFEVEDIVKILKKKYNQFGYWGVYYGNISDFLFELVNDGEISVVYVSKRAEDGFRTEGVYGSIIKQRSNRISEILK